MEPDQTKSMLIIGVGNWYRGDDAVGLVVARRVKSMLLPDVAVREESGEGVALMEAWKGTDNVVIVDAVSSDLPPGTIHSLDARSRTIPTNFFHYSSHAFSVAEAIELARALNQLPLQLTVFGIEGKTFAAGVGLSEEVEKAADQVALTIADHAAMVGVAR